MNRHSPIVTLTIVASVLLGSTAFAQVSIVTTAPSDSTPESFSVVPSSFGADAGELFIPDSTGEAVYAMPSSGGPLTTFVSGLSSAPTGGLFIPSGYGPLSGEFLVSSGKTFSVSAISDSGAITTILSPSSRLVPEAAAIVAPANFGAASNEVLVSGFSVNSATGTIQTQLLTLNPNGTTSAFSTLVDAPTYNTSSTGTPVVSAIVPFGTTFAPAGFGAIGGDLLVDDSAGDTIEAVDAEGVASVWATVPGAAQLLSNDQITGLRQMAFAPESFGEYGGDLFVSVSGSQEGGGTSGQVDVLNSSGTLVAVPQQGSVGDPFDPRGLYFASNGDLFVADSDPSILSVAPSAFTAVSQAPELDPASLASGVTLLLGSLAVIRSRRRLRAWPLL